MMPRLKAFLIGFVSLVVVAFVISWLCGYLHTGNLVIKSSSKDNFITIASPDEKVLARGQSGIKARLHTGKYVVTVKAKLLTAKQTVTVSSRKTSTYAINPPSFSTPEPVAGFKSRDIVASNTSLRYFDTVLNSFVSVDSSGNPTYLSNAYALERIKWADPSFGVGQDKDGRLFTVTGDSVKPLLVPGGYDKSRAVSYDVTESRQVYVSSGSTVYMGSDQNALKELYVADSKSLQVIAGKDNLAVVETSIAGEKSAEITAKISLINDAGKRLAVKDFDVNDTFGTQIGVGWSPDGKKILINNGSSRSIVFDAAFKKIAYLPENHLSNPTWLDNDKLLYSVDNNVWLYDLTTQASGVAASFATGAYIDAVVLNQDRSYVYLSTSTSIGGGIYRFGLDKQEASDTVYKLGVFLPLYLQQCAVSFVNYAKTTVVLVPYKSANVDACRAEATSNLQDDQIDTTPLVFSIGPPIAHNEED